MCSHEDCKHTTHYIIDCKDHVPMDLGMCKIIKRDGKECGCPVKRSSKGINTCLIHVPKSSTVETCSICLDDCKVGTKITACGHFFHPKCMREWKARPNGHTCPVCRFELTKPKTEVDDITLQTIITLSQNTSNAEEFIDGLVAVIDPENIEIIMRMMRERY